jgi:hypothetical protein
MVRAVTLTATLVALAACGDDSTGPQFPAPKDPVTAVRVPIDRFSASAAMLFVRTAENGLPAANAPIDMDTGPFITSGLGPNGERITYYNFDVQPVGPAPIFVLYREGQSTPVQGQLNIVDVIPGEAGYNDFWQVMKVTVPASYVANSITSVDEIRTLGLTVEPTSAIVNCPIVPEGSVARLHIGPSTGLTLGWYRGQVVSYFNFDEAPLAATAQGEVPVAPIFVSFTINPDAPGGGAASGFKTEPGSDQTHNVAGALPGGPGYSPLWNVLVYDNAAFASVSDLTTAGQAPQLGSAGIVNCPIVAVEP